MRKSTHAAAAALFFTTIAVTAQAQSPAAATLKLGYVNTQALMAAAPGKAAAESLYNKELALFAIQQRKWGDSLTKLVDDYKKAAPKMTDAQKQAKELQITGIQGDLDAKNQAGQEKMQSRQNELLAPLMEIVKKAIDDIRTEDGYAIIFSGDANTPIVSADKNLDITDRVVSRLKATKAPAPSSMQPAAVTKKPPTR